MIRIQVSKIAEFSGHKDAIFCLQSSLDRSKVYTGAADGMIVEWDAVNPGDGELIVKVSSPVYSMLMEEGQSAYAGTSNGNLHYIDLKGRKEKRNIQAHEGGVFSLLRLPSGELLSSGGDGKVRLWNPELELLMSLDHSDKSARIMAMHPRLPLLAVGYSDHMIRLFDSSTMKVLQVLEGHSNSVFSLAWSKDGKKLLSGGRDAMLRFWDLDSGFALEKSIPAHWYHINDIAFNPDGHLFATCSLDKTIKIWDAASYELLKVIDLERYNAHKHSVNKLVWVDRNKLASSSDDRMAMLFSVNVD